MDLQAALTVARQAGSDKRFGVVSVYRAIPDQADSYRVVLRNEKTGWAVEIESEDAWKAAREEKAPRRRVRAKAKQGD